RLEQIYSPAIELTGPLTAHAVLRARPAPAAAGGATAPPAAIAKDLVTVDGAGRDLGGTPQTFQLDGRDGLDGTYQLAIEVRSGDRALGTATLLVNLRKGLEETVAKLEADAKRAPEPARADVLYPVDRTRNVNRGRIELRTFEPDKDFADAQ